MKSLLRKLGVILIVILLIFPQITLGQDRAFIEAQINRWIEELRKNPDDFETMAAIGGAYGKVGDYTKAIEYFQKAIAVNPSHADAYLGLATSYGFLGRLDEKIAACKKAIALKPDNTLAYVELGSAFWRAEKYKESVKVLKEAVRLKPDFADAHLLLGIAYISLGYRDLAIKECKTLMQIDSVLANQLKGVIDSAEGKK